MVEQVERVPPELDVRSPEIVNRFDSDVSKLTWPGAYRMPRPLLP